MIELPKLSLLEISEKTSRHDERGRKKAGRGTPDLTSGVEEQEHQQPDHAEPRIARDQVRQGHLDSEAGPRGGPVLQCVVRIRLSRDAWIGGVEMVAELVRLVDVKPHVGLIGRLRGQLEQVERDECGAGKCEDDGHEHRAPHRMCNRDDLTMPALLSPHQEIRNRNPEEKEARNSHHLGELNGHDLEDVPERPAEADPGQPVGAPANKRLCDQGSG